MGNEKQVAEASTRKCMECGRDIFSDKKILTVLIPPIIAHPDAQAKLIVFGMCCEEKAKELYRKEKLANTKVAIGLHYRKEEK